MYGLEKNWKGTSNLRVNLLGPGPRLKKKIHRAAVSQRLRNTDLNQYPSYALFCLYSRYVNIYQESMSFK